MTKKGRKKEVFDHHAELDKRYFERKKEKKTVTTQTKHITN